MDKVEEIVRKAFFMYFLVSAIYIEFYRNINNTKHRAHKIIIKNISRHNNKYLPCSAYFMRVLRTYINDNCSMLDTHTHEKKAARITLEKKNTEKACNKISAF
jgi:hypothetical protein